MSSNVATYQSILEQAFEHFLHNTRIADRTIANYVSDFRHFLSWFIDRYVAVLIDCSSPEDLVRLITPDILSTYSQEQTQVNTPASTLNRRLSALRAFFKYAIQEHWITINPMDSIQNISTPVITKQTPQTILAAFEAQLQQEGAATSTIKSYVGDVDLFLHWLSDKGELNL